MDEAVTSSIFLREATLNLLCYWAFLPLTGVDISLQTELQNFRNS